MMQRLIDKYIRADESVTQVIHVSWLYYRYRILGNALLIIIAFFFLYPLLSLGIGGIVIFFILLAVGVFGLVRIIIIRSFNLFIITNHRIIDIDQQSLFHRSVSECQLAHIQDVRYNIKGVVYTLFQVGTVQIFFGSADGHIEFNAITNPAQVKELLIQTQKLNTTEKPIVEHEEI